MIVTQHILDTLTAHAKVSPLLLMNYDLRNSAADSSQRILNAIEPGKMMPIHRYRTTSVTVVYVWGHLEEYLYDGEGRSTETIDMAPCGVLVNILAGH